MYSEDHSRYVLLSQNNNRHSSCSDKRTLILCSVLLLPVIIFCGTYMTLFGVFEKTVYPITLTLNVRGRDLERAIKYNTVSKVDNNTDYTFVNNAKNFSEVKEYKLVCYYNFPGKENYALKTDKIDPFLCTHINLAFATVVNNTIYLDKIQLATVVRLVALKQQNPKLKVLVSVGGAGNDQGYPEMVSNHTNRKSFIKSALYYVKHYNIDGVDLDWEFPNVNPGSDKRQRQHFTQLLEEFRATINRQEDYKFLITVAVATPINLIDLGYDISYINEYVDYVNLMSYDYHFFTKYTPFTGINSPLYASSMDASIFSTMNINYSVNYWNFKGMDKNKIVVGLPTYGHSYKLTNPRNWGLYAPAMGYGKLGELGFVDYSQVCLFLTLNHISPVFDMDTKSPYAAKYTEWISFDDEQSLSYKAEFIRDNHFGGAMVYSLNSDDHKGLCFSTGKTSYKNFPLINTIKQVLTEKPLR